MTYNYSDNLTPWLRTQSDKWDMPVGELILFVKGTAHDSGGDITAILEIMELPEEDRHIISAIISLR